MSRGRSISVTVCQYAAPQDKAATIKEKKVEARAKRRPLSLTLSPASSTSSMACRSRDVVSTRPSTVVTHSINNAKKTNKALVVDSLLGSD